MEHTRINTTSGTSDSVQTFCTDNATLENCEFNALKGIVGWSFDTRDRILFPTRGTFHSIGAQLAVPAGDDSISFYKLSYDFKNYLPLDSRGNYVFQLRAGLAYGDGYGETPELPPFERYYAGGVRTVRGYRGNSLGPLDAEDDPTGGNARILGNAELIFRGPFSENSESLRLGLFLDGGNVFNGLDDVEPNDLRYSAGLALYWITPVGPLSFSYSRPLNDREEDTTELFQFSLGTPL